MKVFTKQETIAVFLILAVIFTISAFNFKTALRRGRDNERENDLGDISKMLDSYKDKNSEYPARLSDIATLPKDPGTPQGYSYLYITDGKYYQLYASLEGGTDESVYKPEIEKLGLKCGNFVCNFGVASGSTPLDKSLEVYENELQQNVKKE
jgi:type II secretory pathway pseudopilin PulG